MDGIADGSIRQRHVLYVEDHPVNALLMQALFKRRPRLKLLLAGTGQQAVCLASGLRPALVLLDLHLPDCHGSQLLDVLRLLPGWEDVPAVAVTAEDDFDITGTGFCELWAKPLDLAHVLQRLDALTDPTPPSDCARPPGVASAESRGGSSRSWR
jgi:CheY-like chemotaxis protein